MAVFDFLKVEKKGVPAAQIAELEASLDKLRAERASVQATVENHGQRRVDMLLSDADDGDIVKLDSAAELARIRLERLELAEVELTERIARLRNAAERERRAGEYERAAGQIETAAKALEGPISALAAAFAELIKSIPAETGIDKPPTANFSGRRLATADDIGRAILANGLHAAMSAVFETVACRPHLARMGGAAVERALFVHTFADGLLTTRCNGLVGEECTIDPASITATRLIVEPLRRRAAALRGGDAARLAAAE
ncbi:hypothetical protein [Methylocystis hirsuta]|uniref:Uncharacterized protein n=1 Tax=Methylocystis hirsuta TaxID=369798 RepID=A0A3M9XPP9_9HYPH|nr:hypothetical protein [Methylocystis hirsuta]RNJ50287.1 hypothetical protein D1O30_12450 [Methylocystis hirsuta]